MAANPGYEIPAHLYSLLKSTRTLIAKAIVRKKSHFVCTRMNWVLCSYKQGCTETHMLLKPAQPSPSPLAGGLEKTQRMLHRSHKK